MIPAEQFIIKEGYGGVHPLASFKMKKMPTHAENRFVYFIIQMMALLHPKQTLLTMVHRLLKRRQRRL
jgi:hypothetical protein